MMYSCKIYQTAIDISALEVDPNFVFTSVDSKLKKH